MNKKLSNMGLTSLDALRGALMVMPDQTMGIPYSVSDIGEPYVAIFSKSLARPGDEKIIEHLVVTDMCEKLDTYFEDKVGRIFWRVPFETDVKPYEVVMRFDVNGPDVDFITGQQCVKDKNWVRIAAYCRLVRSKAPIPERFVETTKVA